MFDGLMKKVEGVPNVYFQNVYFLMMLSFFQHLLSTTALTLLHMIYQFISSFEQLCFYLRHFY